MVTKVVMPRLSLAMKEGTVVTWFKKEGEAVKKGDPLVEVLSEKVTYDVEAPSSGILRKIVKTEGADVLVAGTLGIIAGPDEHLPEMEEATIPLPAERIEEVTPPPEEETLKEVGERVLASPAAKRFAREHDIDLTKVKSSSPGGRISEADVRQHLEEKVALAPRVREVVPLTGIRKTTAERVSLSARTAPHSTLTMEVDMSNAIRLREKAHVSHTDILVKAVAQALEEHRSLNSTLKANR